jgi:hypothetical protein
MVNCFENRRAGWKTSKANVKIVLFALPQASSISGIVRQGHGFYFKQKLGGNLGSVCPR